MSAHQQQCRCLNRRHARYITLTSHLPTAWSFARQSNKRSKAAAKQYKFKWLLTVQTRSESLPRTLIHKKQKISSIWNVIPFQTGANTFGENRLFRFKASMHVKGKKARRVAWNGYIVLINGLSDVKSPRLHKLICWIFPGMQIQSGLIW